MPKRAVLLHVAIRCLGSVTSVAAARCLFGGGGWVKMVGVITETEGKHVARFGDSPWGFLVFAPTESLYDAGGLAAAHEYSQFCGFEVKTICMRSCLLILQE